MKKKTYTILAIIIGAILIDQITKGSLLYLLTSRVPLYANAWELVPFPYIISQVTSFFNLVFTWNPGTSFSLFRALGESAPLVIIILTGIVIGIIGYYVFKRAASHERWPLALIVGGALGNLIDRVRFGAVIDFLDFHAFGYHWPAFNVADICIVVGVGLYILNWFLNRKSKK